MFVTVYLSSAISKEKGCGKINTVEVTPDIKREREREGVRETNYSKYKPLVM